MLSEQKGFGFAKRRRPNETEHGVIGANRREEIDKTEKKYF